MSTTKTHRRGWKRLTDGGFTELLVRHLVGDVGAHQDADLDLQLLSDDVRNEPQSFRTLVDALKDNESFRTRTSSPNRRVRQTAFW